MSRELHISAGDIGLSVETRVGEALPAVAATVPED